MFIGFICTGLSLVVEVFPYYWQYSILFVPVFYVLHAHSTETGRLCQPHAILWLHAHYCDAVLPLHW
jgi:hypothetical protein